MSDFEWAAIGLMLFGMVIPFWLMTYLTAKVSRTSRDAGPHRIMRYNEVMDYLHSAIGKSKVGGQNGATLVAAIRELKEYTEHRDLTVLYLEEVEVTGSNKFDDLMRAEIKNVEAHFLGSKDG